MTRIPLALLRTVGRPRTGVSPFVLCPGLIGAEYDTRRDNSQGHGMFACVTLFYLLQQLCL